MTGLQTSQLNRAIASGAEQGMFSLPKGPSGKVKLAPKVKTNVLKEVSTATSTSRPSRYLTDDQQSNQPAAPKKTAAKAKEPKEKDAAKAPTKKKTVAAKPAAKKTSTAKATKKEVSVSCSFGRTSFSSS